MKIKATILLIVVCLVVSCNQNSNNNKLILKESRSSFYTYKANLININAWCDMLLAKYNVLESFKQKSVDNVFFEFYFRSIDTVQMYFYDDKIGTEANCFFETNRVVEYFNAITTVESKMPIGDDFGYRSLEDFLIDKYNWYNWYNNHGCLMSKQKADSIWIKKKALKRNQKLKKFNCIASTSISKKKPCIVYKQIHKEGAKSN